MRRYSGFFVILAFFFAANASSMHALSVKSKPRAKCRIQRSFHLTPFVHSQCMSERALKAYEKAGKDDPRRLFQSAILKVSRPEELAPHAAYVDGYFSDGSMSLFVSGFIEDRHLRFSTRTWLLKHGANPLRGDVKTGSIPFYYSEEIEKITTTITPSLNHYQVEFDYKWKLLDEYNLSMHLLSGDQFVYTLFEQSLFLGTKNRYINRPHKETEAFRHELLRVTNNAVARSIGVLLPFLVDCNNSQLLAEKADMLVSLNLINSEEDVSAEIKAAKKAAPELYRRLTITVANFLACLFNDIGITDPNEPYRYLVWNFSKEVLPSVLNESIEHELALNVIKNAIKHGFKQAPML